MNSERSWCWREVPEDFEKANGIPILKMGEKDLHTTQSPLSTQEGDRLRELKNISKHKVTGITQYRFMKKTSCLTNMTAFFSEN